MKQQTITLSHKVIIPTDFTDFMKLSNVEFRAISYSMMQRVNELEKDLLSLQQASRHQGISTEPSVSIPVLKKKSKKAVKVKKIDMDAVEQPRKDLHELARERDKTQEPDVVVKAIPSTVVKKKTGSVRSKTGAESSTLNKKIGKSSKYHFLNVQKRGGTFYCYRAGTTIDGKSVGMGIHKDEIQCALLADAYLDNIGDEKRTRNREDFPEVMEAYQLKQAQKEK